MTKRHLTLALVMAGLTVSAFALSSGLAYARIRMPATAPAEQPAPPKETRKLLSDHQTVAKLTDLSFRKCRGLTTMCPDNCGHSGTFANFEILTYLVYDKAGEYGDPKATTYMFQVEDNHKKSKLPKDMAEKVAALKAGDYVLLSWHHDYVTSQDGGSFPDRPLTKLEKITQEQAEKLIKEHPAKE
jgi:hypothetical protein